ncbi:hypothetical protein SAMN05216419_104315 [Nitrosomonas cryotolerans]|nr:hypothetical protein SAMN05216419_104315 [Nitrosomonas cryotolerans]
MQVFGVVEGVTMYSVMSISASVYIVGVSPLPDTFHLEIQKESFRYGIVKTSAQLTASIPDMPIRIF